MLGRTLIASLAGAAVALSSALAEPARELWLYQAANLQVEKNVDALEALWRRAAAAGYTHVLLTDSKFARLGDLGGMEKVYFGHVARVRRLAEELKLTVVPALYHVGWSNSMLWHNPNLAEGLPVKDQPFVVRGGALAPANEPPVQLGKPDWHDASVKVDGETATVADAAENARFAFKRKLPPFRCYRLSVSIRTEGFTGTPEIKALAGGRSLQWQNLAVRRTQALARYDVVFNTLDGGEITLYFGAWGGGKGTLVWQGWRIEESAFVNVLRRPGAPVVLRGEGGRAYAEGAEVDRVEDPRLGRTPYKGEYEAWHKPPAVRARLPEGTRVLASWYHPAIIYNGAVMACPSEPQTDALLQDEARRLREAWGAGRYMMAHDEIRTLNWDASCAALKLDAGPLLAGQAKRCAGWLAGAEVCVWSDMFDPHHNARDGYYLVRGDLRGSWEGLEPSVIVVNWNSGHKEQSLGFFARRGHRQVIAGYYDAPVAEIKPWLDAAAAAGGVIGVMYTTWRDNYADLEAFAALCRPAYGRR
jgi:hypothetical protein